MAFWITGIVVFVLDRLSKHIVMLKMDFGQTIPVINGFFHLTLIKNPGAAFGILAEKKWFFIIVTLVIICIIIYLAISIKPQNLWLAITLGLVAGGAGGNLVDRIQTGLVIDFIDFRGIWPFIFNVADSSIVVGVIMLVWQILRWDTKQG